MSDGERQEPTGEDFHRPLSKREQRFVEEYLVDLNASAAIRRCGYNGKNASSASWVLLARPWVARAVAEAIEARSERTEITQDKVLRELAIIGFSDLWHYEMTDEGHGVVVSEDAPEESRRALRAVKRKVRYVKRGKQTVKEVETEVDLWDKPAALVKLGQHLGMFSKDTEAPGGLVIRVVHE